jgi:hypothetical protein
MYDYDEPVKSAVEEGPIGGVHHQHESYGMISVSRQTGGSKDPLFGSEIESNNTISIQIHKGCVRQDLGRNWYYSGGIICEAVMSPTQYAELISNPNTQGSPCTLRYTQELGNIKYRPVSTQTQYVESKIEKEVDDLKETVSTISKEVSSILSQKGALKKADKDAVNSLVSKLVSSFTSDLPFYEESLKESIEKQKAEARTEIESYLHNAINRVGLEALKRPETLALVMQSSEEK